MEPFWFVVPLRTKNPLNGSQWSRFAVSSRRKKERHATSRCWPRRAIVPPFPVDVLLVRRAPSNGLDDDGLCASLKAIRDEVALQLGVTDGPRDPRVRWLYGQERGTYSVVVTITRRQA